MDFLLDDAEGFLARTPATLRALLRGLPDAWTRANEGGDTFSAFDVVGHLIHGERDDWIPRLRIILQHGESKVFDPFDRFAQREASRGKTLLDLLDEFARARDANVRTLHSLALTEADLDRTGTHPAFGRVTARELLATWVAHDLDHLAQIARVLAHQYRGAVGPWRAYLPILVMAK